tara:strand:- start:2130 stop:2402 length:273 start_codon:yes stop_codon:yes gene_type:complete
MGTHFTDRFSLLHVASGIISYYWDISLYTWFIIHLLFEYLENTHIGMKLINTLPIWPGGKDKVDNMINRTGDQVYAVVGWFLAYMVCSYE